MERQIPDYFERQLKSEGYLICSGRKPDELDNNAFVQIMWRTGDISSNTIRAGAVDWSWSSDFPTTDIIACKVEPK